MGPFKKLPISKFAQSKKDLRGDDVKYWSQLKYPVTVQENSPINYIEIQPEAPHWVAVTGSSKVQLYNPQSNEVVKSFNKFKDGSFGASFRSDGKLLAAGTEEGTVRLFDVATKTLLRSFRGHSRATQRVQFVSDMKRVVTFSDDQVVKLWDTATEQCTLSFEEHKDYVRSGCVSRVSPNIFLSGSFDHTVKLWDDRKSKSVLTLNHGDPVEAILLFPNDGIVASAGGNDIKIWDVLSGGRLLSCLTPHNKTITAMGICNQGHRFFSTSLDCHLKFHDLSKFQTVHSIKHVSPLLTAAISPDDSLVASGMSDGLVQFMHRKKSDQVGEIDDLVSGEDYPGNLKYLNFTKFQPGVGDVVIKKDIAVKESKHDTFLRKFEFSKALDSVLKPYVQKKFPEYTYSVLKELKRRNALQTAIGGRSESGLAPLLNYISRNISNPNYTLLLVEVADALLDVYGSSLGGSSNTSKLLVDLQKRLERETRTIEELMGLQGIMELVLSGTNNQRTAIPTDPVSIP